MDPLAVLAGMDAMDATEVPVEEIPDSDGEFDDRSLEGSDVDVLSSDEEELLDDELLGDGTYTSSGASGDSSQSGTEDSDEDSDEQNDGGAVRGRGRGARGGRGRGRGLGRGNPVGRGKGNLRTRGREVAVVERADEDEDGEERMPTTTQRLATTTRMTVDCYCLLLLLCIF